MVRNTVLSTLFLPKRLMSALTGRQMMAHVSMGSKGSSKMAIGNIR